MPRTQVAATFVYGPDDPDVAAAATFDDGDGTPASTRSKAASAARSPTDAGRGTHGGTSPQKTDGDGAAAQDGDDEHVAVPASLSALSKRFLDELAQSHHRAEWGDNRAAMRSYTQRLADSLAKEEARLAGTYTPPAETKRPTAKEAAVAAANAEGKELLERKAAVNARLVQLGYSVRPLEANTV